MTFNNPKLRVYSLLIFISFSVFIINIQAQTKSQTIQLSELCRVWGLLKYYHPEIATGKHDWDAVLISSIDTISKSKDQNQVQLEIKKMLEIAGDNPSPEIPSEVDSGKDKSVRTRNLDFSWIEKNKNLTLAQKQKLQHLTQHPFQGVNYYAQIPSILLFPAPACRRIMFLS